MSDKLDMKSIIPQLLKEYSEYFSPDERMNFDDELLQDELFQSLLQDQGEIVCRSEYWSNSMAGSGVSSILQLGKYFFVDMDVEIDGPYESLDDALANNNTCRYISDVVTDIYIDKPMDEIDWVIVAEDGYTLNINDEKYIVKNGNLVKYDSMDNTFNNTNTSKEVNISSRIGTKQYSDEEKGSYRPVLIIVPKWPDGTMAMKLGSVLGKALLVEKEAMVLLQMSPERIFRVETTATEEDFRKSLEKLEISMVHDILFIEL